MVYRVITVVGKRWWLKNESLTEDILCKGRHFMVKQDNHDYFEAQVAVDMTPHKVLNLRH